MILNLYEAPCRTHIGHGYIGDTSKYVWDTSRGVTIMLLIFFRGDTLGNTIDIWDMIWYFLSRRRPQYCRRETKMWGVEGDKFDSLDDVGILGVTMISFKHEMDDGGDGNDNFGN